MKFSNVDFDTYFKNYPDANGFFGKYGGCYIPPELQKAMDEINTAYQTTCKSRRFISELRRIRKEFQGRPTPSPIWSASPASWAACSSTSSARISITPARTS